MPAGFEVFRDYVTRHTQLSEADFAALEAAEPRHQPLGGERRRRRHGEMTAAILLQQLLGRLVQLIERRAHRGQIGLPCLGEQQGAISPHKQF